MCKPKKLISAPIPSLKRKTFATIRSAIFLATYVFNYKYTQCIGRNILKKDIFLMTGPIGGLTSGLSLFLEHKKRRKELALYCIPRALQIVLNMIPKRHLPYLWSLIRKQWYPLLIMQLSIAVWLTLFNIKNAQKTCNKLNITVLKIVFGTKH